MTRTRNRAATVAALTVALGGLIGAGLALATAGDAAHGSMPPDVAPAPVVQSYDPTSGLSGDGQSCNYGWSSVTQHGRLVACIGQAVPIPVGPAGRANGPVVAFSDVAGRGANRG
jgi:hypothetical protein